MMNKRTCFSKYFKKKPRRNDFPFRKAPATATTTIGVSLICVCKRTFSKFFSLSFILFKHFSFSSLIVWIICRGSPLSESAVFPLFGSSVCGGSSLSARTACWGTLFSKTEGSLPSRRTACWGTSKSDVFSSSNLVVSREPPSLQRN